MKKVLFVVLFLFALYSPAFAMEIKGEGFTIGIEDPQKIKSVYMMLTPSSISLESDDGWYDYHYDELPSDLATKYYGVPWGITYNSTIFLDSWLKNISDNSKTEIVYSEKVKNKNGIIIIERFANNSRLRIKAMYIRQNKLYSVTYSSNESLEALKAKRYELIETIY